MNIFKVNWNHDKGCDFGGVERSWISECEFGSAKSWGVKICDFIFWSQVKMRPRVENVPNARRCDFYLYYSPLGPL